MKPSFDRILSTAFQAIHDCAMLSFLAIFVSFVVHIVFRTEKWPIAYIYTNVTLCAVLAVFMFFLESNPSIKNRGQDNNNYIDGLTSLAMFAIFTPLFTYLILWAFR